MFMGDPLPEFPHPTRPASSYDTDSDPDSTPVFPQQGFDYQEFHHPQSLSLPKPSPPMDYEIRFESRDEFHSRQDSVSVMRDYCSTDSEPTNATSPSSSESERIIFSPSTGKTPKGEKEAVDELLLILIETMEELNTRNKEALLKKFFSEIEREERLEQFIVERLKNSRVQAINDLCEKIPIQNLEREGDLPTIDETEEGPVLTRSISESVEELSQKLERFKVKTLDLGGNIVKEEQKK